MIKLPSHWYCIDRVSAFQGIAKRRCFGIDLVIYRDNELVIMQDLCPHRKARLSQGKLLKTADGTLIECPFHGFQFEKKGSCRLVPELGRSNTHLCVKTYPAKELFGYLWMWYGDDAPHGEPSFFEGPAFHPKALTFYVTDIWNTSFVRCVENQLDYAHLPYVHARTIGRFASGCMPEVEESDKQIAFASIEFRYPNVWCNSISPTFALTLAFVPVDDRTTRLILGYHHMPHPFLRPLFWCALPLMRLFNRIILNEDKRIVLQQDKDNVGEVLFPSDKAIRIFRAWLKKSER